MTYSQTQKSCINCDENIDSCLTCSDERTCTQCYAGYHAVTFIDSFGIPFTGCLWDFCGYDV